MNPFMHLFGPVPSRRYGRSLGVDLAVPKTCTLNCRFCQLGATVQTTVTRTDTPPIAEVLGELRDWFASGKTADFITASGSGEPTLHLSFGELFRFVRDETSCRSLLLTNGTLFFLPEVRRDAARADVVKISLHAWDQASFERITRPHASLRFDTIIDGYRLFRQQFSGRLDLEVFIIPGINDNEEQARRIADLAQSFCPDAITLNTAVRPPADLAVTACPAERLQALVSFFGPHAHASGAEPTTAADEMSEAAIIALVCRHPVSLHALAVTFKKSEDEMLAILKPLAKRRLLRFFESQNVPFAGPPLA